MGQRLLINIQHCLRDIFLIFLSLSDILTVLALTAAVLLTERTLLRFFQQDSPAAARSPARPHPSAPPSVIIVF